MTAHRFFGCARSGMMGPDYGAVDDQVLLPITHDLQMAVRHGRRMLVLGEGELVYDGPPDQVVYSLMER